MFLIIIARHKKGRIRLYLSLTFFLVFIIAISGTLTKQLGKYSDLAMPEISDFAGTKSENTFVFRILLLGERALLVLDHNPFIGYGFIHEDNATKHVRYIIGTETEDKKGIAFKTPDIAWANLVIYTGFTGVAVFIIFIISIIINYFKGINQVNLDKFYLPRLSFFLQIICCFMLMANSYMFTDGVQIPALILASYTYCCRQANLKQKT
jgi:hypothetical protein